ncbi:RraA family protein, partial [Pseudomonas putida]|nr:RraA family protein [Pseudomonas putida]
MSLKAPLERLAVLDTNTVSDALDFLQLPGATNGLMPLW